MSHLVRRGLVVTTSMVATVALACGAVASSTVAPDASSDSPPAPSGSNVGESDPDGSSSVTLLTGDVVEVNETHDGRPTVNVDAVTGSVQRYTVGSDIYVVPEVAQPYLAAGTLDDQLFNVTKLLEYGYDDASADTIPLIATYDYARSAPSAPAGADVVRPLDSIGGAALAANKDATGDLWTSLTGDNSQSRATTASGDLDGGVDTLWLDGHVESTLDVSVPQVHAPEAWEAGFDGSGATVAVLDSGIDAEHPDITDALTDAVSFVPDEEVTDVNGHGTHVASTVLGDGTASDGLNQGVAPGAELAVGKVLADDGFGQDSWLIAGMEWAAENADVVNMSLGDSSRTTGQDPLSQALNQLTEQTDTLFVVAAGNDGAVGAIGAPGAADKALTVGAVDDNDQRTWFTSMGPRTGDGAIKPDLSAPGQGIVAARSQFATGEGAYQSMDGTSMASPHVAGAAAIVRTAHPDWSAEQVKNALMSTTDPLDATPYELGAGRLNVAAATTSEVTATGSAFFGRFEYPHDGDEPVEQTITYTNHGATDASLTLSPEMSSADGPVDMLTLSADEVTVPAGDSVDIVVTADPDAADGSGRFTGFVVATTVDGTDVTRTALALDKEAERYDVDVTILGPDGEPATGEVVFYRYGDQFMSTLPIDPATGAVPTQRIAPGIVNATAMLEVEGDSGPDSMGRLLLGDPHVDVTGSDVELVFDARDAVPVSLETPQQTETQTQRMQYFHDSGIGGNYATFTAGYEYGPDVTDLYAVPTGPVDGEMYDFTATWRNSAPLLEVSAFTPRRTELDPIYQQGSVRLDGRVDLHGVDAGTGTAEEYADIDAAGKAVVVTRSDDVAPADRAAAAQDAGAALLIVANDEPGRLYEFAGGTDLPVVAVTAAEGEILRQGAEFDRLRLRGAATEFSPYMYMITEGWPGEIPSDLTLAPTKDDMARIDNRFIGNGEKIAFSTTSHCRDYQWPPCLSTGAEPQETGTARTDYLSTDDGNTWYHTVSDVDGWEQRGINRHYAPGSVTPLDWLSPVVRPRLGDGYWGARFNDDWFTMNVPPSSGPHGITGSRGQGYDDRIESRLYQEGELVGSAPAQAVQTTVPAVAGPASYRYEMDTVAAEDEPWANSTRTSSDWEFVADQAETTGDEWAYLPLLQLDYELDLELDGTADAPRRDVIGVSASHEEGVVGGGDVVDMTLEVSYDDGATWTDVPLRADGTGVMFYPEDASWVSLRATAQDDAGNGVEQEIIRAYSLD